MKRTKEQLKKDTAHTPEELTVIKECIDCTDRCKDLRTHILLCRAGVTTYVDVALLAHLKKFKNGRRVG